MTTLLNVLFKETKNKKEHTKLNYPQLTQDIEKNYNSNL